MKITFPKYNESFNTTNGIQYHRYYNIHFKYVLNLLTEAGCNIEMVESSEFENFSKTCFEMKIDGKLIAIDFSDHLTISIPVPKLSKYAAVFKFHYKADMHGKFSNIYPFSPVSFQKWVNYKGLLNQVKYKADGLVLCKQVPGGAAIERRQKVQEMLEKRYGNTFDKKIENEIQFYLKINQALVSVFVPGVRNDMLDRGQFQYMAFGCCTISPKLVEVLSGNKPLMPGVHYVECKPDYSDLISKIEWVRQNPISAIEIGQNAKRLFEETSLPECQVEWLSNVLSISKNK